jgi:hypothetical protein
MSRYHREVLLLSAFDTLPSTSPGTIRSITLSLPVEGDGEAAALQKFAQDLAEEHDLNANVTVQHDHLIVRLARRYPMA